MKFILFICISLFASSLHVAAMPIHNIGDSPMSAKSEMAGQHSIHQHSKMMESDHHKSDGSCPSSNGNCCLTLSIPFNQINSIALPVSDEVYAPPFFSPPKLILETLYRPPKISV